MTLEENCSESCVQNCSGRWENFEDKCYKRSEDEKIASLGSGRIGIPPSGGSNQTTTEETKTALSSAGGVRVARGKESFLSSGTMRLVRKVQNLSVQRRFVTTPPRPHHLQRTLVPISHVHSLCAINFPFRTPYCNNYSGNKCFLRFDHIRQPRFPGTLLQYHYLMSHFAYRFWALKA